MTHARCPPGGLPIASTLWAFLLLAALGGVLACGGQSSPTAPAQVSHGDGRLRSRPVAQHTTLTPAGHQLNLELRGRDGMVYVPRGHPLDQRLPLAVMLHGGGGNSLDMEFAVPLADEFGVFLLVPDSRSILWDALVEPHEFGPDADYIDRALAKVFETCAVDPDRIAVAGFSDGASYALALGVRNGDLFTHLIAFSPGFLRSGERYGRPRVFISHGTDDHVLSINRGSRVIVPQLLSEGYDVTYREFQGGHVIPDDIAHEAFEWLVGTGSLRANRARTK